MAALGSCEARSRIRFSIGSSFSASRVPICRAVSEYSGLSVDARSRLTASTSASSACFFLSYSALLAGFSRKPRIASLIRIICVRISVASMRTLPYPSTAASVFCASLAFRASSNASPTTATSANTLSTISFFMTVPTPLFLAPAEPSAAHRNTKAREPIGGVGAHAAAGLDVELQVAANEVRDSPVDRHARLRCALDPAETKHLEEPAPAGDEVVARRQTQGALPESAE